VEEYHKMGEAGIFGEGDRVELVEGEIVQMTPIGWRHAETVNTLNDLLANFREAGGYTVSVQNPVMLSINSEHQPDLALLRTGRPRMRLPNAGDVLLVVEVADTSLVYDRDTKLPLYARAGVPEAWLVDLRNDVIEIHAEPSPDGYKTVRKVHPAETVTSTSMPEVSIEAGVVLGMGS
jgi:Uma2 family endonuclease